MMSYTALSSSQLHVLVGPKACANCLIAINQPTKLVQFNQPIFHPGAMAAPGSLVGSASVVSRLL